ncbi:hypothetical protein BDV38DRAFT_241291 [Aspergillus pseudotamarii]|uniref:Uncharacterized protein n=1 Tax=Aspergillus pseudotamarii TaxID=132259 RepID=A0A5N6SYR9_ASPPS|nr:uncharacterized protein BDV38DRAFT_241291 [Aspergillus pseudotamarii]KAE8139826.1 hypothetical protein BDV38DRAFT_241291 [Aspergillus pseudotamarii]
MAALPDYFTITLGGSLITRKNIDPDEQQIHAEVGHTDPAIFTLNNDGLLESGDWYLGRFLVEDRSLLPKRVLWHKKGGEIDVGMIQKTTIEERNGELVIRNGGAVLAVIDEKICGDLMNENPVSVEIHEA